MLRFPLGRWPMAAGGASTASCRDTWRPVTTSHDPGSLPAGGVLESAKKTRADLDSSRTEAQCFSKFVRVSIRTRQPEREF